MGSVLRTLTSDEFGQFTDLQGDNYRISRDEIFVTTKNVYVPEDADNGIPSNILVEQLIDDGQITKADVAGGIHCMHPNFLAH